MGLLRPPCGRPRNDGACAIARSEARTTWQSHWILDLRFTIWELRKDKVSYSP